MAQTRANDYVVDAHCRSLARSFADRLTPGLQQPEPEKLPSHAFMYELQGIETFELEKHSNQTNGTPSAKLFERAYDAWESLATLPVEGMPVQTDSVSSLGVQITQDQFGTEPFSEELFLAFHLAACALLAELPADARLMLRRFSLDRSAFDEWGHFVCIEIARAFVLLVRKHHGWDDIEEAIKAIDNLRTNQQIHESQYLSTKGESPAQAQAAAVLVGLYHLAQVITVAGTYLVDGGLTISQLTLQLDRHRERANTAFNAAGATPMRHFSNLLWAGCVQLCQNSIWTHMSGLGEGAEICITFDGKGPTESRN